MVVVGRGGRGRRPVTLKMEAVLPSVKTQLDEAVICVHTKIRVGQHYRYTIAGIPVRLVLCDSRVGNVA